VIFSVKYLFLISLSYMEYFFHMLINIVIICILSCF
jgi:hypothetical protein